MTVASSHGRWYSYAEVLAMLSVPRRTMDLWRAQGKAPRFAQLPNRELRTCDAWLNDWLERRAA